MPRYATFKEFANDQSVVLKALGERFEHVKFEEEHSEDDETVKKLKEMVTVNRINWFNGLNELLGLDVSTNNNLSEAIGYAYCQICGLLAENGGDKDGICYAGGQHSFLCDALYDSDCSTEERCDDAHCKACHLDCDVDDCDVCRIAQNDYCAECDRQHGPRYKGKCEHGV